MVKLHIWRASPATFSLEAAPVLGFTWPKRQTPNKFMQATLCCATHHAPHLARYAVPRARPIRKQRKSRASPAFFV